MDVAVPPDLRPGEKEHIKYMQDESSMWSNDCTKRTLVVVVVVGGQGECEGEGGQGECEGEGGEGERGKKKKDPPYKRLNERDKKTKKKKNKKQKKTKTKSPPLTHLLAVGGGSRVEQRLTTVDAYASAWANE